MSDVTTRHYEYLSRRRKPRPVTNNTPSSIGHPCMRYLVYSRLDWDKKAPPDDKLLSYFDLGTSWHEMLCPTMLMRLGYRLRETEASIYFKEQKISGRLDSMINHPDWGDVWNVCDQKTCSPHIWDSLHSLDDIKNHPRFYVRSYAAQLMLYLLGKADTEEQRAVLFLWNKVSGEPREIWITLDLDFAESLLQKAEQINKYVEAETYPDRITYDKDICGRCDFKVTCIPDLTHAHGLVWMEDEELEGKLDYRSTVEEGAKAFGKLDKEVKAALKARFELGETNIVLGDWLISGKQDKRGAWRTSIQMLEVEEVHSG